MQHVSGYKKKAKEFLGRTDALKMNKDNTDKIIEMNKKTLRN